MSTSPASTHQTAWRMSASLASTNIFRFLGILYLSDLLNLLNLPNLPFCRCLGAVFLKYGLWQMCAILVSISKLLGECCKFGESAKISQKGHFGKCEYLPKIVFFQQVLAFAKFVRDWPLLIINTTHDPSIYPYIKTLTTLA